MSTPSRASRKQPASSKLLGTPSHWSRDRPPPSFSMSEVSAQPIPSSVQLDLPESSSADLGQSLQTSTTALVPDQPPSSSSLLLFETKTNQTGQRLAMAEPLHPDTRDRSSGTQALTADAPPLPPYEAMPPERNVLGIGSLPLQPLSALPTWSPSQQPQRPEPLSLGPSAWGASPLRTIATQVSSLRIQLDSASATDPPSEHDSGSGSGQSISIAEQLEARLQDEARNMGEAIWARRNCMPPALTKRRGLQRTLSQYFIQASRRFSTSGSKGSGSAGNPDEDSQSQAGTPRSPSKSRRGWFSFASLSNTKRTSTDASLVTPSGDPVFFAVPNLAHADPSMSPSSATLNRDGLASARSMGSPRSVSTSDLQSDSLKVPGLAKRPDPVPPNEHVVYILLLVIQGLAVLPAAYGTLYILEHVFDSDTGAAGASQTGLVTSNQVRTSLQLFCVQLVAYAAGAAAWLYAASWWNSKVVLTSACLCLAVGLAVFRVMVDRGSALTVVWYLYMALSGALSSCGAVVLPVLNFLTVESAHTFGDYYRSIFSQSMQRLIVVLVALAVLLPESWQNGLAVVWAGALTVVAALVWHVLQEGGVFSKNTAMFLGKRMSDASEASYKGLRLVGVDGTTFNVGNTPTMKATAKKTKTRRGEAAFYRISCVALAALLPHRPLAVRIGEAGESEGALAERIIGQVGENDLLIADRYYGSGKWMARLDALPSKPLFLLRVQERFGSVSVKRLADGSKHVHIKDPDGKTPILCREIKAKVRRPGNRWTKVRFWTNLMDDVRFPALELVALYARRWEQEIAFRELKVHIHSEIILKSHTLTTAVQEICALFMAQAVVVAARVQIGESQEIPTLQISFQKVLEACRKLCWLWALIRDEIDRDTWAGIEKKVKQDLEWQATKPRRKRSCPRKVRQPVTKWPRLMKNSSETGEIQCRVRKS